MIRGSGSQILSSQNNEIIELLKNFPSQNERYQIDEFITFLKLLPIIGISEVEHLKPNQLSDLQISQGIVIQYLEKKLQQTGDKGTFKAQNLQSIIDQSKIDIKLVEQLCQSSRANSQEQINIVKALISSHTSRNKDGLQISNYMKTTMRNSRKVL